MFKKKTNYSFLTKYLNKILIYPIRAQNYMQLYVYI